METVADLLPHMENYRLFLLSQPVSHRGGTVNFPQGYIPQHLLIQNLEEGSPRSLVSGQAHVVFVEPSSF